MRKLLIINILIILLTSIVTYFAYVALLQHLNVWVLQSEIQLAYFINTVLAVVIMGSLYRLRKRFKDQLGFVFMGGSFLKFICFFIFFYPGYNADGNITRYEFFSFFIPYSICLITETLTSIRLLNRLDKNS